MTNNKQQFVLKLTLQQLQDLNACVDYSTNQADDSRINILSDIDTDDTVAYYQQMSRLNKLNVILTSISYNSETYALYTMPDGSYHTLDITALNQTIIEETNESWLTAAIVTEIVSLATNNAGDCIHWGSADDCLAQLINSIDK